MFCEQMSHCVEPPQVVVFVQALDVLLECVAAENVHEPSLGSRTVKYSGRRPRVSSGGVEPSLAVHLEHCKIPQGLLLSVEAACSTSGLVC